MLVTQFTAENDPHEFMVFRMEKEEAHFRAQLERVRANALSCVYRRVHHVLSPL